MIRLTGGRARGHKLRVPSGTRPTPSMVREALFNLLGSVEGRTFLDLYAGSGAVALEAASRGALVHCVEHHPHAVRLIRDNARRAGLNLTILAADATLDLSQLRGLLFDIVFIDPPYTQGGLPAVRQVLARQLCTVTLILQHPSHHTPLPQATVRRYGSNALSILSVQEAL